MLHPRPSKQVLMAMSMCVAASRVFAEAPPDVSSRLDKLEQDNAQLREEVAKLRGEKEIDWLNARRKDEIKSLIKEVLADADQRASLLADGGVAGHNGQNFFLASADGSYLMQIGGLIQARYAWNHRGRAPAADQFDEDENGFELARAKLEIGGHIGSPKLYYIVRIGVDREDNEVLGERVILGYEISQGLAVFAGEDKAPFTREELIDPARQLAVDRSLFNEFFTAGYVQGAFLRWEMSESLTFFGSINDGFRSGEADNEFNSSHVFAPGTPVADIPGRGAGAVAKPFFLDRTDIAMTARLEWKITGDWAQAADFSSASDEGEALFLGGAVHYELGETGSSALNDNFLAWTFDAQYENAGFNLAAAVAGFHTDLQQANQFDFYGAMIQGGFMLIPDKLEPFARFEWIDLDGHHPAGTRNDIYIVTAGFNYYIRRHHSKVTVDVMYSPNELPNSSFFGLQDNDGTGQALGSIGLREDADGNQFVLRAQFQLLF